MTDSLAVRAVRRTPVVAAALLVVALAGCADMAGTGSLMLDIALGIGGLPKGRVIEIYGPESSGKTTLTLQTIAECQKAGGTCAFIDAEHALDPIYAQKLGVNLDELYLSQPDTGEQALEIADMLVRSNAVDMVVVDSVAGRLGLFFAVVTSSSQDSGRGVSLSSQ